MLALGFFFNQHQLTNDLLKHGREVVAQHLGQDGRRCAQQSAEGKHHQALREVALHALERLEEQAEEGRRDDGVTVEHRQSGLGIVI